MSFKTLAVVVLALVAPSSGILVAKNSTAVTVAISANATAKLDPFASAADACDYCFGSYTKTGDKPAGPVAPFCICMAYPSSGGHLPFCATPPSAAGYIKDKNGCRCKAKDMEAMGATTCKAIA